MATPGSNSNMGKKDRREAAREKARLDREAERKRTRRNKIFLQSGVGLAVIAIAAIVMLVIVNQPKPVELSNNEAGPANMISDGILLTGSTTTAVKTPGIKKGADPVPTDPSKYLRSETITSSHRPLAFRSWTSWAFTTVKSPLMFDLTNRFW